MHFFGIFFIPIFQFWTFFGQFMNFTRNNPVASLIGYDVLRKAAGGVKNQLKPVGVSGGKAIRVSAGR